MTKSKPKKSILDYFPRNLSPRPGQRQFLLELEKKWDSADVFVCNLPTAFGKSAAAVTIAKFAKKASIITPTKMLTDQYTEEYGRQLQCLRAKSDYYCDTFKCSISKRPTGKDIPKTCPKIVNCYGCQSYRNDLAKSRVYPYLLSNYYIYLAHKLYRDCLILDEGHLAINVIKEMNSTKIWQFKHGYPSKLKFREGIKNWVNSLPEHMFNQHTKLSGETEFGTRQDSLIRLKEELNSYRPKYMVSVHEDEKYHDEEGMSCIKMIPVDVSGMGGLMWPSGQVRKIVLFSGTINRKDIEQLGLSNRRVQYIEAGSPIDAQKRPVVVPDQSRSMAYTKQELNLPKLQEFISEVAKYNSETKGLIHATYGLARNLEKIKFPPEVQSRLIFHDSKNKKQRYQDFRDSSEPKILIASGMYEGIDLKYDAGRWQIIAKVPWPSLADEAIKYLAEQDDEWYMWEALKSVIQATGRICRDPSDYGETYIFCDTFKRLYRKSLDKDLVPGYFREAVYI